MLINDILLFRYRKEIDKNMLSIFYIFIIVASVSLVLEIITENFSSVAWGTAFSVMYMIFNMQIKQIRSLTIQSNEIERQKARIAVLEMRPHYIYNTMTSIYYLCESDPEKAQKMTLYFTNYLRKNFNAVASEDLIPFSEEIEHTKAYLNVENVRPGKRLTVNNDIGSQNFKIPPLTLQPIVENAVKHGISPESDNLTINISARERKTFHEVIVTDNGKKLKNESSENTHSALTNIQIRLKNICHGKLEITKDNTGSTAGRLVIPKQNI